MDDHTRTLVARARTSDQDAIEELFRRYRDALRRALRRSIGPAYRTLIADSEDATHDAILVALRNLDSFEYRGDGSFLAWLMRQAEHSILNRIKAGKRQKRRPQDGAPLDLAAAPEPIDPARSVAGAAEDSELREALRDALDELPARERDVILLRRFLELEADEIAVELGLPSPSAVRNLYARAQARLAGVLTRRGLSGERLQ